MAITVTELVEYGVTDNAASAVSTAYQPTANRALLAFIYGTGTVVTPAVSGNGVTWTQVGTANSRGTGLISCFKAYSGSSPTNTGLTADFGADAPTACVIHVVEINGADPTSFVVQYDDSSETTATGTPDVTFGTATTTGNGVILATATLKNPPAQTAPPGFTEMGDFGQSSPVMGMQVSYHASPTAATVFTWGAVNTTASSEFGVELKAATGGDGNAANTAEGGSDNTTVTEANSGGTSGDAWQDTSISGTVTFDNERLLKGSMAYKSSKASAVYSRVGWNDTVIGTRAELWFRAYYNIQAYPSSASYILAFYNAGTFLCGITMGTTGVISLLDQNGAAIDATAAAIVDPDEWFRIEARVKNSGQEFEAKIYDGHSTTPLDTISGTAQDLGAADLTGLLIGAGVLNANVTFELWFDEVATSTTAFLGPVSVTSSGSAASALPNLTQSADGDVTVKGAAASSLPALTQAATGTAPVSTLIEAAAANRARARATAAALVFRLRAASNRGRSRSAASATVMRMGEPAVNRARSRATANRSRISLATATTNRGRSRATAARLRFAITGATNRGRSRGTATRLKLALGASSNRVRSRSTATRLKLALGVSTNRARSRATATRLKLALGASSSRSRSRATATRLRFAIVTASTNRARSRATATRLRLVSAPATNRARSRSTATRLKLALGASVNRARSRGTATRLRLALGAATNRARSRATATRLKLALGAAQSRARSRATAAHLTAAVITASAINRARSRATAARLTIALGAAQNRARSRATAARVRFAIVQAANSRGRARAVASSLTVRIGRAAGRGRSRSTAARHSLGIAPPATNRARSRATAARLRFATSSAANRARSRAAAARLRFAIVTPATGRSRSRATATTLRLATSAATNRARSRATATRLKLALGVAANRGRSRSTAVPSRVAIATAAIGRARAVGRAAQAVAGLVTAEAVGRARSRATAARLKLAIGAAVGRGRGRATATRRAIAIAWSPSAYAQRVIGDGATGLWRLGETTGTVAAEARGLYPGSYLNTPTLGDAGALVESDTAVTFAAASSEYVSVPHDAALNPGVTDYSVEAWVKRASNPAGSEFVLNKGDATTTGYEIFLNTSGFPNLRLGAINVGNVGPSVCDGVWHHVAFSLDRDGNGVYYLDGVAKATISIAAEAARNLNAAVALEIARRSSGNYLTGSIDEVAIYSGVALTAALIATHYRLGRAQRGVSHGYSRASASLVRVSAGQGRTRGRGAASSSRVALGRAHGRGRGRQAVVSRGVAIAVARGHGRGRAAAAPRLFSTGRAHGRAHGWAAAQITIPVAPDIITFDALADGGVSESGVADAGVGLSALADSGVGKSGLASSGISKDALVDQGAGG